MFEALSLNSVDAAGEAWDPEKLRQLLDMGLPKEQVSQALANARGDVERALAGLLG